MSINNTTKIEQLLLPFCTNNYEHINTHRDMVEDKLIETNDSDAFVNNYKKKSIMTSNTEFNDSKQLLFSFTDESTTDTAQESQESNTENNNNSDDNLKEDSEFINVYSIPKKFRETKSDNFKLLLE